MRELKAYSDYQELMAADGKSMIVLVAPGCKFCEAMKPVLEHVDERVDGAVTIATFSVDAFGDKLQEIDAFPTFLFFQDGEQKREAVGAMNSNSLLIELKSINVVVEPDNLDDEVRFQDKVTDFWSS
jgi:thiol-disulfide isomerase/thioredoxin